MKYFLIALSAAFLLAACSQEELSTIEDNSTSNAPDAGIESAASDVIPGLTESNFEIEHISGNVYRGRSNRHFTIFMVTSEGTILADPINVEFSQWLKTELAERFDSEVRYLLYSHHHWDHASGGAVFQDTAELVGHENMIPGLAMPMPANYAILDANGDGAIQREEARGGLLNGFDGVDANGDGNITGSEINANVVAPTTTYSDAHSVHLGSYEAQLIYIGENHSDDGSIIFFPEEGVALGADWLNVKGFPRTFYGVNLDNWAAAADILVALNPRVVVPGHGEMGSSEDAISYAQYFRDMDMAANVAVAQGLSAEEFVASLPTTMAAYSTWNAFDSTMVDNAREAYEMASAE